MKRRVYIAGPITKGDMLHNVRQADDAFFALLKSGVVAPWNPIWSVFAGAKRTDEYEAVWAKANSQPNGTTHADWMGVDLPWVAVSEAVLRLPGESVGADAEVAEAERIGIPVFHEVSEVLAWAKLAPLDVPAILERIHSDDLAPEGMAGTLLHTPSDPAGTKLGDLPLAPPPAQAPSQQYRPDGTPLNPTFLPDLPSVDPGESLLSQDVRLREMERNAAGK